MFERPHIEKAKYFRVAIDDKLTFNRIHEQRILELNLKSSERSLKALSVNNEFIRFIWRDWYMDITIRKIVPYDGFRIHLGKVIDYSKPHKT